MRELVVVTLQGPTRFRKIDPVCTSNDHRSPGSNLRGGKVVNVDVSSSPLDVIFSVLAASDCSVSSAATAWRSLGDIVKGFE